MMRNQPLINDEIENMYLSDAVKCSVCGLSEDLTVDEDGKDICTDCLFERESDAPIIW